MYEGDDGKKRRNFSPSKLLSFTVFSNCTLIFKAIQKSRFVPVIAISKVLRT